MAFRDFRYFLEALTKKGELREIKEEVHWDEELGAVLQEAILKNSPAPLFTNIKDYKDGHARKISALTEATLKRVCISLGVPENSPRKDLINLWRTRTKSPIKPILVSSAPWKEMVHLGEDVDLFELPVPKLHPLDGGRYLLTWATIITKDPETGWTNLGTYRGMVLDKNSIGMLYSPYQHWALHGAKYAKVGKPMPLVAAIGLEPIIMMVSTSSCPPYSSEYDIIGGVRQDPLEIAKGITTDLEIPAGAEIVLEGEMSLDPSTFRPEGPFGEYQGHYTSLGAELRPVFKVKSIAHRKDPILTVSTTGLSPSISPEIPGTQSGLAHASFVNPAWLWDHLERLGIPGIVNIGGAGGAGDAITIVSIRQQYFGHAKQVASAIWAIPKMQRGKYVIVVDEDIDVSDLNKVMIALAHRTRAGKSITTFNDTMGGDLDPGFHPDEKRKRGGLSNYDRVLIDATWPYEWEPREDWGGLKHPPACRARPEMISRVREKWNKIYPQ